MTRQEVIDAGYKYYCPGCNKVFKEIPKENYEDGHGGRQINMCRCGCDLVVDLITDELAK